MTPIIFGDSGVFAIEAAFAVAAGTWRYGRFRFWVHGRPVGNFDDNTVDLASSARWGRTFLAASARRLRADLDVASAEETYDLLHGRFVDGGGADPTESFDSEPYLLDHVGESSVRDRETVLIVRRSDDRERLLVRDHRNDSLVDYDLPPGVCDKVIASYCDWAETL